ncbi:phage distal tail protein [Streptomyces sp. NPDC021020]|uniref:phage distal tail protein n=1 Tax=Streptomyces sp. NPDC021020 TaxID=3365109 RepID=UPI0037B01F27
MPILTRPSGPPTGGLNPPPLFPSESPDIAWTDARGRTTLLSDWENGWLLQPGTRGLDMPAWTPYTDESPAIDGNALRGVRATAREVFVPVVFFDTDRSTFLERKRAFMGTLNPYLGLGTLTVTEADGSARTIGAYYLSGAEGDTGQDTSGMRWQTVGLTFSCPSPYWLGDPQHLQFNGAATGTFFPVLPLVVQDSQVFGDTTITNLGDAAAYPVWTIHGPATSVEISNATTGLSFSLTAAIGAGDVLVVDTREREQTAVLNGTDNWWPNLSDSSALWNLAPGVNDISLAMVGTTSDSSVHVDYQLRYLTA